MLFIMIIDGHCNAPLFSRQHVDSQNQSALKAYDVISRNGPAIKTNQLVKNQISLLLYVWILDKIGHAGVWIIDSTKAGEDGHDSHANNTNA